MPKITSTTVVIIVTTEELTAVLNAVVASKLIPTGAKVATRIRATTRATIASNNPPCIGLDIEIFSPP